MTLSYKQRKVDHVSNLTGGSAWEVNLVTLVAPAAVLLWSVLQSRSLFFTPYTPGACLVDFLLQCGAILFATTLYSPAPLLLNFFIILPAIVTYFTSNSALRPAKIKPTQQPKHATKADATKLDQFPIKPFITSYRGGMIIITCVAILAVDFKVFPRRFAKVENWGTSLMDMGVGSFVFTAGTVSVRSSLKESASGKMQPFLRRFAASLRHSLPLLVLGLIRLYSVKGLDYAEHVSEYGVHWNFFFTLGLLPPFMAIFQSLFALVPSYAALAFILSFAYEVALDENNTNIKEFVFLAPRTDLFSANREGIFSFIGYLAIFLSGQATGTYALPRQVILPKTATLFQKLRSSTVARLVAWAVVWWSLYYVSVSYNRFNLRVSRRLANMPYFLWVSAFNTSQMALYCAIETICFPDLYTSPDRETEKARAEFATSSVLRAFNRNGLAIFLIANLFTGAINMTMNTLDMERSESMAILINYLAGVATVALVLDRFNISIKL
ncbi:GPI-anchored wall transfer protein 1 [Pseudovirgaria hyperparasitica]|uniref:GPI-anchored wall transfer protein n=1 Tax=Pseudovirgaria hyperparasitica TaxID=470096 RepID=A0A6A6W874_9PEZI|nr:GPI-anchored wall transfer protein 1 [Pseudovirgaria hyperparasitica]KAF2758745.1 GPI-anchored wall transfer protein 1 [Pseudovirgaria hyperparasitica]